MDCGPACRTTGLYDGNYPHPAGLSITLEGEARGAIYRARGVIYTLLRRARRRRAGETFSRTGKAVLGCATGMWASLQPRLAERSRVCAYDRAGMGWSEDAGGASINQRY
jgi:hypothetical protein